MGGSGGGGVCRLSCVTTGAPSSLFSERSRFFWQGLWKGMLHVDVLFASVRRLVSLLSLFACLPLTFTQHSGWCQVFLRHPCVGFSWMPSFHPVAHYPINRVVYGLEGFFAHDVLMIERPSPDDGVELHDQLSSTESFVRLHEVAYLF